MSAPPISQSYYVSLLSDHPEADVILHSSDNIDLKCYKNLLLSVSHGPQLPGPEGENGDETTGNK